jgi:hypothetical protein
MDGRIQKAINSIDSFLEKQSKALRDSQGNRIRNPNRPVKAAKLDLDEGTGKWEVNVDGNKKEFRPLSRDADSPTFPERYSKYAKKHGATHFVNPYTGTRGKVDEMY